MGRALLFTGEPRVGKSTAVREVVARVGAERFTGFITEEDRCDGRRTGFSITMLDGRRGTLASIESKSDIRVKSVTQGEQVSYGVELGFLEDVAVPVMRESLKGNLERFVVIDEIGPMQLNSIFFKDLISELLEKSGAVTLGTVVARSLPWTDALKSRAGVETFLLTPQNRATLATMMAAYFTSQCRS
jgi:nucleoside-triphosphatase